ncbi:MAG: hydroxymethylbilane synthase [Bacteroidia bacterium]
MNTIRIGSRGSDLALWQANYLKIELLNLGYRSEIIIIKTQGDQVQHLSFDKMEGKGFFTKELEDALLHNEVDVAVHSHKDLPTEQPAGLCIAAVSYRETCTDTLLIKPEFFRPEKPLSLADGCKVGTSSQRRKSQLNYLRSDLEILDLRGNVPTRIEKLRAGNYGAIVLATAGIKRLALELNDFNTVELAAHRFVPAPAQGVLAYQTRSNDGALINVLKKLHHQEVQQSISIERSILNRLEGGCQLPLGVYCQKRTYDFRLWLSIEHQGKLKRMFLQGKNPAYLVEKALLNIQTPSSGTVYVSRDPEDCTLFRQLVNNAGYQVIAQNPVYYKTLPISQVPETDWIFFTSKRAVWHFTEKVQQMPDNVKIASMGSGTAEALKSKGIVPDFTGSDGNTRDTAQEFLAHAKGLRVLFPISADSLRSVQKEIEHETLVQDLMVYETAQNPDFMPVQADIYAFTSPSCVKAFIEKSGIPGGISVAIGRTTAQALEELGVERIIQAPYTTEESLADRVCGL